MRFRRACARVALVALLLASVAALTTTSIAQGSRPPDPKSSASGFVWHDLVTDDPAACRAFYGALFGWTFEEGEGVDPGYTIIRHEGQLVGGIVLLKPQSGETPVAQWLSYVNVADVDRAAAAFERGGGRIIRGPLNAKKNLRVAAVADAQGAPLGLASRGPEVDSAGVPGLHRWLWMEYVALDPEAALKFYGDAVGFGHETHETRDNFTYYLLTTDRPRAGLFAARGNARRRRGCRMCASTIRRRWRRAWFNSAGPSRWHRGRRSATARSPSCSTRPAHRWRCRSFRSSEERRHEHEATTVGVRVHRVAGDAHVELL